MATDVPSVTKKEYKVMYGTHNFAKEAAMTREEAVETIEVGIQMVKKCAEAGYEILATGESGDWKYNDQQCGCLCIARRGSEGHDRKGGRSDEKKVCERRYRSSGKRLSGCSRIRQMRSMYFPRLEDLT